MSIRRVALALRTDFANSSHLPVIPSDADRLFDTGVSVAPDGDAMKTRIKFCGITRLEDALMAAKLGVDALGFVFYRKSPRYVSAEDAAHIIRCLPAFVSTVGLFVNEVPQEIKRVADLSGIDLVQFHGDETAADCAKSPRPWIKAVRVGDTPPEQSKLGQYEQARALLFDTLDPTRFGGTGRTFNWQLLPAQSPSPIILAGGLTSSTVAEAIRVVRPWGVDVSGGIEAAKGEKDEEKMIRFVEQVKTADEHDK